ncbi:MAG: hypothetical protein ACM3SW_15415 [Actinomycetota bacterium]
MKQVEVNSDKYTALGVAMLLVLVLLEFVASIIRLVHGTFQPTQTLPSFVIVLFLAYALWVLVSDRKFWSRYPYALLSFVLLLVDFVMGIALPRDVSAVVWRLPRFLDLVAYALGIVEIARWFRANVKVV